MQWRREAINVKAEETKFLEGGIELVKLGHWGLFESIDSLVLTYIHVGVNKTQQLVDLH